MNEGAPHIITKKNAFKTDKIFLIMISNILTMINIYFTVYESEFTCKTQKMRYPELFLEIRKGFGSSRSRCVVERCLFVGRRRFIGVLL